MADVTETPPEGNQFVPPRIVRRNFNKGSDAITKKKKNLSRQRLGKSRASNKWPRGKVNYAFLETCKEVVCRVIHPTQFFRQSVQMEYRISIMPWSRGSYIDIRQYKLGGPTGVGILLHLDVIQAMLPELIATVRRMENEDSREPENKAKPEVILS